MEVCNDVENLNVKSLTKINETHYNSITFRKYSNTLNKKGFGGFVKTKIKNYLLNLFEYILLYNSELYSQIQEHKYEVHTNVLY